jgi:tRNA (cmo5U34)-methyltransferase
VNRTTGTEGFYDGLARDYNEAILRCVPRYDEMLDAIFSYLPDDLEPRRILELGCGGGHLTRRTLDAFPAAEVVAVDLSREMLQMTRPLAEPTRLGLVRNDFGHLCFRPGAFDLVVSSISIHHIVDADKRSLFRNVHQSLAPGGAFCYSDQFSGETAEIYQKHIDRWRAEARKLGASEAEWAEWMRHHDEDDHHATVSQQMAWLGESGFGTVDCVWRNLLWTVVVGLRN